MFIFVYKNVHHGHFLNNIKLCLLQNTLEASVVCQQLSGLAFNEGYYYYWYSALGPVWAETRAQSGDWYGSGTLHPGQVLRGSLPLLSPAL